jgi:hypothetical protein
MRALICSAPHQAEVIDTERVPPGPGEVLVRSRVVGVCHSDLELLAGRYIVPIRYPGMSPGRPAQLMRHAPNTGRSEAASPRCRLRANPRPVGVVPDRAAVPDISCSRAWAAVLGYCGGGGSPPPPWVMPCS